MEIHEIIQFLWKGIELERMVSDGNLVGPKGWHECQNFELEIPPRDLSINSLSILRSLL